jgi:hypothetical protein
MLKFYFNGLIDAIEFFGALRASQTRKHTPKSIGSGKISGKAPN